MTVCRDVRLCRGPATIGRRGSTPRFAAPDIDLDRVHALAKAVLGDAAFDWPREGALSLKVARAAVAGVGGERRRRATCGSTPAASRSSAWRSADFGGAALRRQAASIPGATPRGAVTLDLDARALGGVVTLGEARARDGRSTAPLRREPHAVAIARHARARSSRGRGAEANAKFKIDGRRHRSASPCKATPTPPATPSRSRISPRSRRPR